MENKNHNVTVFITMENNLESFFFSHLLPFKTWYWTNLTWWLRNLHVNLHNACRTGLAWYLYLPSHLQLSALYGTSELVGDGLQRVPFTLARSCPSRWASGMQFPLQFGIRSESHSAGRGVACDFWQIHWHIVVRADPECRMSLPHSHTETHGLHQINHHCMHCTPPTQQRCQTFSLHISGTNLNGPPTNEESTVSKNAGFRYICLGFPVPEQTCRQLTDIVKLNLGVLTTGKSCESP